MKETERAKSSRATMSVAAGTTFSSRQKYHRMLWERHTRGQFIGDNNPCKCKTFFIYLGCGQPDCTNEYRVFSTYIYTRVGVKTIHPNKFSADGKLKCALSKKKLNGNIKVRTFSYFLLNFARSNGLLFSTSSWLDEFIVRCDQFFNIAWKTGKMTRSVYWKHI